MSEQTLLESVGRPAFKTLARQVSFPALLRGVIEGAVLGGVFLSAGNATLGIPVADLLGPMVPTVLLVLTCMVFSGVYRRDITNSIMNIYLHAACGFLMAAFAFLILVDLAFPQLQNGRFLFFFLFFAFFAFNTVSPLLAGTDFVDGGGRRQN